MASTKPWMTTRIGDLLCLIAGGLLTLSFSPFGIFPLAVLSPALLLLGWLNVSPKKAFWRGFLFGIGLFGSGVYWVFNSVYVYGNAPLWLASIITAGFITILALFPATNGFILNRFFEVPRTKKILLAFPALWVLFEWLRSWFLSGFPWLFVGYSQIDSPLKGYAAIFSVYATSFAVVLTSALLVNLFFAIKEKRPQTIYFALFGIATLWIAGALLTLINWTKPQGDPIEVSLIQGNIPQELKWTPENLKLSLEVYKNLTEQHWKSPLIVWPEAAIPLTMQAAQSYTDWMNQEALRHYSAIITGIPLETVDNNFQNAVMGLGNSSGLYVKERLVPFGEFIPFKSIIGKVLDVLKLPMSDMIPASKNDTPIKYKNILFATFICYEIAFPEQVRHQDGKVGVLLTVTDDAWFGRSIAQAQHLEMGRMRAFETGRPLLFVSNNGITAFITATSKVQSTAPSFERTVLTDQVQPMQGETPWLKWGLTPFLILLVGLLAIAKITRRSK